MEIFMQFYFKTSRKDFVFLLLLDSLLAEYNAIITKLSKSRTISSTQNLISSTHIPMLTLKSNAVILSVYWLLNMHCCSIWTWTELHLPICGELYEM